MAANYNRAMTKHTCPVCAAGKAPVRHDIDDELEIIRGWDELNPACVQPDDPQGEQ